MKAMKEFYEDFGKIIGFMIMTLFIELTLGQKIERYWLIIILIGMVLINYTTFTDFLKDKFDLSK